MEPIEDTEKADNDLQQHWVHVVLAMRQFAQNALRLLADRELDGDPNDGVTELGFKMVFLACFGNPAGPFADIELESEREVDGGRIDLFLLHKPTNSALVVELKYVRVGFLASTANVPYSYTALHKLWKDENEKIGRLDKEKRLEVRRSGSAAVCTFSASPGRSSSLQKGPKNASAHHLEKYWPRCVESSRRIL